MSTEVERIDQAMKDLFIETLKLYEIEREFNYQNYGRYPYRDRKNSVQIIADFGAMAYSVNGLFIDEEDSQYSKFYPQLVVPTLESFMQYTAIAAAATTTSGGGGSAGGQQLVAVAVNKYSTQVISEYIEIEDTKVKGVSYLFPFTATQNLNTIVLSF